MPLPLIPLAWFAVGFAAKWAGGRLIQHGGDHEKTWEILKKDIQTAFDKGSGIANGGTQFTKDAATIAVALTRLQKSSDLQTLVNGCHALKRALENLPKETLAGIKKTFSLDERIDIQLSAVLHQCGLTLLEQEVENLSLEEVLERTYYAAYLVGRSGEVFDVDTKNVCIAMLGNRHMSLGTPADVRIAGVLTHYTPEAAIQLVEALTGYARISNEHPADPLYPVYIAKALGGDIIPNSTTSLLDEIVATYPETL